MSVITLAVCRRRVFLRTHVPRVDFASKDLIRETFLDEELGASFLTLDMRNESLSHELE